MIPRTCRLTACLLLVAATLPGQQPTPSPTSPSETPSGPPPRPPGLDQAIEQLAAGNVADALARLEELRATGDPRVLAALGAIYVEQGRGAEALQVLEPMIEAGQVDPAVLYNAGRAAIQIQDAQRSVGYLRQAAVLAPQSPARRELGLLLGRLGAYARAYPHLRAWATANPDDEETRLAAAVAAVQLERAPEAEAFLAELPQDDPGVQLLWAQTLIQRGDPYGALGYLRPLLESAPPAMDADVRRVAARAFLMVGESQEAIDILEGRVGDDVRLALQLAQAFYQNGNLDAAISSIQRYAVALKDTEDPSRTGEVGANMALEYGRLLTTAGRAEEALPYLRLATDLRPDEKQGWQLLGQALAATGDDAAAQAAIGRFQELLAAEAPDDVNQAERDTADPTGRKLREALALAGRGETDRAVALLMEEANIAPEDPRPPLLISRIVLLDGRPEQALQAADRALRVAPDDPNALYQRGVTLMALQRLEEAERHLRRSLELNPDFVAALNDLAVLLMDAERYAEARPLLERALALNPEDAGAQQNLARLRELSGS